MPRKLGDISSDCHMVNANTTARLWSWVNFLRATLQYLGFQEARSSDSLGTHSLAGVSCLTAQNCRWQRTGLPSQGTAGGQMGPRAPAAETPFTRSCPRRSSPQLWDLLECLHQGYAPGGSQPITAHPVWALGNQGKPDRPQPSTQDPPVPGLGSRGSPSAHSSPFWEPRSRPKGFGLPSFLASFHRQTRKLPSPHFVLPLYLVETFLCKHPPMSSGPSASQEDLD